MLIQIVKRPLLTEKTLSFAARGFYTFVVDVGARKEQIAQAIAKLYNVKVTGVHTANVHGKVRRSGRRMLAVRRSDWKKAIVKLAEGQKIDAFEVAPQESQK